MGNPKLPIYIAMRFENFKDILNSGYVDNELLMRNNPKIRTIFFEIIVILCFSRKKHSFENIKINKKTDFNMQQISDRLKAPSLEYISSLFKENDSKELFIATNEFAYHISKSLDNEAACYWIEWIMEYDNIYKKNKCVCHRRTFPMVQDKFQTESIWIIWESILNQSKVINNNLITKIINALLTICCIKYTSGVKKRRRFIIYFAVSLLTEVVQLDIEMISNKTEVDKIIKRMPILYKQIKNSEVSPNIDYLLASGSNKSNLDKTVERLEKMKKLL